MLASRGFKNVELFNVELICDSEKHTKLKLNDSKIGWFTSFGIYDLKPSSIDSTKDNNSTENGKPKQIILCDLEGDAEQDIFKRVSVLNHQDGSLGYVGIKSGSKDEKHLKITKDVIQKCLQMAKFRSDDLLKEV
ncbi:unnamed protein product [Ambrosiozyma monospora]|uniref:Unnamed protein product n=1 Tax=Ambrosiozyma monospora TaxID=43982 RepID=A0ACB5U7S4_AMBMO|nr:unnamed protein product [Ambrosiozyma monospora]